MKIAYPEKSHDLSSQAEALLHDPRLIPVLRFIRRLNGVPLLGHLRAALAGLRLQSAAQNLSEMADVYALISGFNYFGVKAKPLQVKEEILELLRIVAGHRPRVILELGSAEGGTLFLLARASDPEALLISVDLPGGPFGGSYPPWQPSLFPFLVADEQKVIHLQANSQDSTTLQHINRILGASRVDLLFIDADHTYEGVKRDFKLYGALVRRGGLIVLHDIASHPPETGVEVDRFWNEIKDDFEHREIIRDPQQGWGGIGVLYP